MIATARDLDCLSMRPLTCAPMRVAVDRGSIIAGWPSADDKRITWR